MSVTKVQVLRLYKRLLRESTKFNTYNFRMYFLQKTRDEFRCNKQATDVDVIQTLVKKAEENLEIIKRQVVVGQMYGRGQLVIEHKKNKET